MQSKGKAWIFGTAGAGVALVTMIGAVVLMSTAPEANAASCARGTKPAVIGGNFKCLRVGQRCLTRYQGAYRRYSFHCTNGRLRRGTGLSVTPAPSPVTPPPPPAPTPAAVDGHYKGKTSQNETFEFDIGGHGSLFNGLETGQINVGCTPQFNIYWNYLHWNDIRNDIRPPVVYGWGAGAWGVSVFSSGDFTIDTDLTGWHVGEFPASEHVTIRGHMAGPVGTGTLEMKTAFNGNGVSYTCGSGLQTWTVTRTG